VQSYPFQEGGIPLFEMPNIFFLVAKPQMDVQFDPKDPNHQIFIFLP
jgi:hypothetical protein